MVIDSLSGKPCVFWESFARSFLPKLTVIDWAFALFGNAKQRLGDRLAGTVVVKKTWKRVRAPSENIEKNKLEITVEEVSEHECD